MDKLITTVFLLLFSGCVFGQNNAPKFEQCCDMSNLVLPETTAINDVVYTLKATDPDNDKVYYYIDGDQFRVDINTGEVSLSQPLDYELVRQIKVVVTASDSRSNTHNSVTVQVVDRNDEFPVFTKPTYTATLNEDAPAGTKVIDDLSVTDKDIVNSQLRVECRADADHIRIYGDVCGIFVVSTTAANNLQWKGYLELAKTLDFEVRQSYQVPLVALDGKNMQNRSVEVNIQDIQDTPPKFVRAAAATIDENIPRHRVVTVVEARDGDAGVARPIVYEIYVNPENVFRIDRNLGIIRPNKAIDREDPLFIRGYVDLILKAREKISDNPEVLGNDPLTTAQTTIRVNVNDLNDNAPLFDSSSYQVSIPEDIPTGSPLPNLVITITDKDQKYAFKPTLSSRYDITLLNFKNIFAVFPDSGRATTVAGIRVKDTSFIDYDTPPRSYELKLKVQESDTAEKFSSTAIVKVNIEDVNDIIPAFVPATYRVLIPETSGASHSVVHVRAVDKDTNQWGAAGIKFELLGNGADLFNINSKSGYVTVRQCAVPGHGNCIDYEQTTQYTLSVSATDDNGNGLTVTTSLIIDIIDENDNEPKSVQSEYYGTIEEHKFTLIGTGVTVKAIDADANSRIRYSIISHTGPPDRFRINAVTGRITGNPQKPILFQDTPNESGIITLTVQISDGKHTSQVNVIITVIDVNDGAPVFESQLYTARITESTLGDVFITTVKATDIDSSTTNAGKFRYSIESGSHDKFTIDGINGRITTTTTAKFDFDVQKLYKMQVHAGDFGNPHRTGTTFVHVHIVDANNRNPVFPRDTERAEIYENAGRGTWVITMRATDSDANSQLQYSMEAVSAEGPNGQALSIQDFDYRNLFRIDSSLGNVTVNQALDRDVIVSVTYKVTATDISATTRQTGTANLIIRILDINDKPPVFRPPWTKAVPYYHITIDEELPIGRFVGIFSADDPDGSIKRYEILNDINNYFSIQLLTGRVQIDSRIDYDAFRTENLQFTVRAYDSGIPELWADAIINVTVLNINDNRPLFRKNSYSFSIAENKAPGSVIDQPNNRISAIDRDLSPCNTFTFSLDGANGVFEINPNSGVLSLSSNPKLDRETLDNYNFDVIVTDVACKPNGTVHENSAPVSVIITDVNDNVPKFTKTIYTVTVLETLTIGASIVMLSAADADISDRNSLTFSKVYGLTDPEDLFAVVPSGLVVSRASLRDKEGEHKIDVEVRDNGGVDPFFSSQAEVLVKVLEVSNHLPEWIHPKEGEIVDVLEEQYLGMLVYDCHAIDRDGGENGRITYGLHVEGKHTVKTKDFRINPITGVIRAERVFDRETKDSYSLLLVAHDNGGRPKEVTRFLYIRIRDVNDHLPHFTAPRVKQCNMRENQPVGKIDCKMTAKDEDIDDTITYVIRARDDNHAFSIDSTTGQMSLVKLLPEGHPSKYSFEIEARNERTDMTVVRSRFRRAAIAPNIMSVTVNVIDLNNHAPIFVTKQPNICVSAQVTLESPLFKMIATDADRYDSVTYNIRSVVRHPAFSGDNMSIFNIQRDDGVIINKLLLGLHYGKVFSLTVDATDGKHNASAHPKIFVTDHDKAVALVVKQPRESVVEITPSFQKILMKSISKEPDYTSAIVCISSVKSHVASSGTVNDQWSDLYFNAFRMEGGNYELVPKTELASVLGKTLGDKEKQKDLLSFNIAEVKTASQENSVVWTRPLLIVLIIVCVLIAIALILICVCCGIYCCSNDDEEMMKIMSETYETENPNAWYHQEPNTIVMQRPPEFATGKPNGSYDNADDVFISRSVPDDAVDPAYSSAQRDVADGEIDVEIRDGNTRQR